ncbi:MAG: hypothetical protein RLZZ524_598 [Pseudomonadota bacterium]|jgi:hypothetical protein
MSDRFLSDLVGTLKSSLRIAGIRLKNVSDTVLRARNKADTQDVGLGAASMDLRLPAGTNRVRLAIGSEPAADLEYKLPVADGATDQALVTDGAGQTSWKTVGTGANQVKADTETIAFGTSSPVTILTPPASCTIKRVTVEVETAFDGTAPNLSVGVSGTPARYMATTENDLKTLGIYEVMPEYEEDGTPEAIIVTFNADSSSAGSCRVCVEYANPA